MHSSWELAHSLLELDLRKRIGMSPAGASFGQPRISWEGSFSFKIGQIFECPNIAGL
jgi:hypothetical protein